jgi:hypothetical protein
MHGVDDDAHASFFTGAAAAGPAWHGRGAADELE